MKWISHSTFGDCIYGWGNSATIEIHPTFKIHPYFPISIPHCFLISIPLCVPTDLVGIHCSNSPQLRKSCAKQRSWRGSGQWYESSPANSNIIDRVSKAKMPLGTLASFNRIKPGIHRARKGLPHYFLCGELVWRITGYCRWWLIHAFH